MTPTPNNTSWEISIWGKIGLLLLIGLGTYWFLSVERPSLASIAAEEEGQYIQAATEHLAAYDNKEAIAAFTKAIEIDPDNAISRSGRAEAFNRIGKYNLALQDITAAISLAPEHIPGYLIKGEILHGLHEYPASIAALSHYIEQEPTDPKGYFERAYSYHRGSYQANSDYNDRAIADFKKAIDLNEDSAPSLTGSQLSTREKARAKSSAYFGLGLAYCHKQDFASALLAFESSNTCSPGNTNTLKYIERVREKLATR